MPTFLDPVDFARLEARNLVTQKLSAPPLNPIAGLRYYDTALNKEGVYNGTSWDYSGCAGVTSLVLSGPLFKQVDTLSTIGSIYVGEAIIGAASTASSWRVRRISITTGSATVTWAGAANFDQIWTNRLTLTYG